MTRLGAILAIFGFGSALLHFTDVQFRLFMWSEPWQPFLGLGIGTVGAVFLAIPVLMNKEQPTEGAPQQGYAAPPPGYAPQPASPPGGFAQPAYAPQPGYGPGPYGGPHQGHPPIPQQGPHYVQRPPQGPPPQRGPQQGFGPQGGPPFGPQGR